MLNHPNVQRKAQEELDRVIKPGHLPTLEDEEFLPYTTAVAKEVLRWKTVAPIGKFQSDRPSFHSFECRCTSLFDYGGYIQRVSDSCRFYRHCQRLVSLSYPRNVLKTK